MMDRIDIPILVSKFRDPYVHACILAYVALILRPFHFRHNFFRQY